MGVYINMEMPEDSDMIVIYSDGTARKYLSYTKVIIDEAKAVPIPLHGRLIDADALLMRINHEVMEAYMDGVCYGMHPNQEYLYLLGEIIDDTPTIIPAEKDTDIQKEFMQNWHEEDE